MPKVSERTYSRQSREALKLLGRMIRARRLEQRQSAKDLAERIGVSRALLQRMEAGDAGCSIGTVFEACAVLGVPLFDPDPASLPHHRSAVERHLTLLPKSARREREAVLDDF